MSLLQEQKSATDFYKPNTDWTSRNLENDREIIQYQNDSTVRIWYNEQPDCYAPHSHNAMEVIIPVDNYYDAVIDGETCRIMPGEIFIIPPMTQHELIAPKTGKRFIFLFDISMLNSMKSFCQIEPLFTECLHITKASYPQIYEDIYQIFMQMRNEYFSDEEFHELSIYSRLIDFFVIFGKNHLTSSGMFSNVRVYKQKEYMQKFSSVLDYIEAHYAEELTLDDVASYSGFSKYHFMRLFKQYTDSTFYEYLSYKRIKVAEQLLAEPNLSITEIALHAGFSSISTFNRIFKKHKNCTPSEYRSLSFKAHSHA